MTTWLAVVPTLGRSEHLAASVAALRREGADVLVVAPRGVVEPGSLAAAGGVEILETDGPLGFAEANLAALAAAPSTDFLALVNDDAVVETGWAQALLDELDTHPRAASAQGVVLRMSDDPEGMHQVGAEVETETVDGAGLGWNPWWQAVQRGHGSRAADNLELQEPREIFGVSATVALYRRSALDEVGPLFEPSLGSYYEDVDLAVRLRAAGWTARLVPAARARHAGSTTGRHLGATLLIRRNRYTVLARALGAGLLARLPWVVLRDAVDAAQAVLRLDLREAVAIARGTLAGLLRLPRFLRFRGLVTSAKLRRWMESR